MPYRIRRTIDAAGRTHDIWILVGVIGGGAILNSLARAVLDLPFPYLALMGFGTAAVIGAAFLRWHVLRKFSISTPFCMFNEGRVFGNEGWYLVGTAARLTNRHPARNRSLRFELEMWKGNKRQIHIASSLPRSSDPQANGVVLGVELLDQQVAMKPETSIYGGIMFGINRRVFNVEIPKADTVQWFLIVVDEITLRRYTHQLGPRFKRGMLLKKPKG